MLFGKYPILSIKFLDDAHCEACLEYYMSKLQKIFWIVCEQEKVMSQKYNTLVEEVKKLSVEEKEELKFLIEKYLVEARRDEIFKNYQESKKEIEEEQLEFSGDIKRLKEML